MANRSQIQIKCILGLIYVLAAPLAIGACQSPPIYIYVDGSKEMYLYKESNYFERTLLSLAVTLNQWQPALKDRDISVPSITVQGIGLVKKARVPRTPTFYEKSPGKNVNKLRETKWLLPGSPKKGLPQKRAWPQIETRLEKHDQDNSIVLLFSNFPETSALSIETDPKNGRLFIPVYLPDRDKAQIGELAKDAFSKIDIFLEEYCVPECPTVRLEVPAEAKLGERVKFRCRLDGTDDGLQFRWDFGDDQTSKQKAPHPHRYMEPDCYQVRLKIINREGTQCFDEKRKITIRPKMSIEDMPGDVLVGKTIRFAMDAPGALRHEWNFGDESKISSAETPQHSYKSPGVHRVKATAFFKCDQTVSDDWTIRVHNVLFSPEPPVSVDVGETVSFRFESDTADKPKWDFDDDRVSTKPRPTHAYEKPGVYTVELTVGFANTQLHETIEHTIHVGKPVAKFEFESVEAEPDADRAEPNVEFSFKNTSVGFDRDNDVFSWDFGDDEEKRGPDFSNEISHKYDRPKPGEPPADYRVRLLINRRGKIYKETHRIQVSARKARPIPQALQADFEVTVERESSAGPGMVVSVRNTSEGYDPASSTWDFGDNTAKSNKLEPPHTYQKGGEYTVALTVSSPTTGEVDTKEKKISIPVAAFSYSPKDKLQPGVIVSFTNTSTNSARVEWDFDDGSPPEKINLSDGQTGDIKHEFKRAGLLHVRLTAWAPGADQFADTHSAKVSVGPPPPVVDFSFEAAADGKILVDKDVVFTNLTEKGNYDSWKWYFGDGESDDAQDPIHAYVEPGIYTVTLEVLKGSQASIKAKKITVVAAPQNMLPVWIIVIVIVIGICYGARKLLGGGGPKVSVKFYRGDQEVGHRTVGKLIRFDTFGCSRPITLFVVHDPDTDSIQVEFFSQDDQQLVNVVTQRVVEMSAGVKSLLQPLGEYRITDTDDRVKIEELVDE